MTTVRDEAIARMHQDHAHMADLIRRIEASCVRDVGAPGCIRCNPTRYQACRGSIDDLIRSLVEVTLKHNAMEALAMRDHAPPEHRQAHQQDHVRIAERMNGIRVVLSQDGDCVLAIAGIDEVLASFESHNARYDRELEGYLEAAP